MSIVWGWNVLLSPIPIAIAWGVWLARDRAVVPRWRRWMLALAVTAATLNIATFYSRSRKPGVRTHRITVLSTPRPATQVAHWFFT